MSELALFENLPVTGDYRTDVFALEDALSQLPQHDFVVRHHFAHGTMTRELDIPAGVMLTGKIHRHSCINMLIKGKIAFISDDADGVIEAPVVFVSPPDTKKAGYALEDCTWVNVFPWDGVMTAEEVVESMTENTRVKLCQSGQPELL